MKRRNPYLFVGVALAILIYIVLVRGSVHEGLETATFICNENQSGNVPPGATKVKYGAGDKWAYKDAKPGEYIICVNAIFGDPAPGTGKACYGVTTTADPPAGASTMGMMPGMPCSVSETTKGLWKHKGDNGPERNKYSTAMPNSSSPGDCGTKCCSDNKCTAFTHVKNGNFCWLYYDELDTLEVDTAVSNESNYSKGTVDRTGGLGELQNKLSAGLGSTVSSVYGVLGSGLSIGAIVGIILAVLAIGIPLAVYGYKFFGGKSLPGSTVPIGNPVTRMSVPVAK